MAVYQKAIEVRLSMCNYTQQKIMDVITYQCQITPLDKDVTCIDLCMYMSGDHVTHTASGVNRMLSFSENL